MPASGIGRRINTAQRIYQMVKRPSLTKTLTQAAFFSACFAGTPKTAMDPVTYQRAFERYLKRFSRMPDLALRTIARAAAAEATRSIRACERIGSLPPGVKIPVELPADAGVLADLIAKYKAKSG